MGRELRLAVVGTILAASLAQWGGGRAFAQPTRPARDLPEAELREWLAGREAEARAKPDDFDRALALAVAYTQAKHFEDAERELARAESLPGAAAERVALERGELRLARGETEAGRADILAVARTSTRSVYAWEAWERAGDIALYYRDRREAGDDYERALRMALLRGWSRSRDLLAKRALAGGSRDLWLTMAAAASRDADEADDWRMGMLGMVAPPYPDQPLLHLLTGLLHQQAGRTDQAIASTRRAVELDPDDPVGRYTLAKLLQRAGQSEASVAQFEEVLGTAGRLADVSGEAHLQLGEYYRTRGEFAQAYAHYEQAVPALSGGWRLDRFAVLALRAGTSRQAAAFMTDQYTELRGTCHEDDALEFLVPHAALYGEAGDFRAMQHALDGYLGSDLTDLDETKPIRREEMQELRDAPPEAAAQVLQAMLIMNHAGGTDWTEALPYLDQAIAVAPDFGLAHYFLGSAVADDDAPRAKEHFQQAAAFLPPGTWIQAAAERAAGAF